MKERSRIPIVFAIVVGILTLKMASAQVSPGSNSRNFIYLNGVLTDNWAVTATANGFNALGAPKWYSMGITRTVLGTPTQVRLEGSLDNVNWSTIAVTSSVLGFVSNTEPHPAIYMRLRANGIANNVYVTATAIGTW